MTIVKAFKPESRCCIRQIGIIAVGATMLFTSRTSAADAVLADVKDAPKPPKWESNITLGATLTRGNSKSFMASGLASTKRTWTNDEALFGAGAGYGDSTSTVNGKEVDSTTQSYVNGYGQWDHFFTPQLYGGLRLSGVHDDMAALTYRFTVSPLVGYYVIKQSNTSLAVEAGPSYVWEKFFSQSEDDYLALRLGERGEHKFASGAKIWESLAWLDSFPNYLLNAEAGVSAPVMKALSVSLVLQDTYNSKPATGKESNDLKLIAGLTYNF